MLSHRAWCPVPSSCPGRQKAAEAFSRLLAPPFLQHPVPHLVSCSECGQPADPLNPRPPPADEGVGEWAKRVGVHVVGAYAYAAERFVFTDLDDTRIEVGAGVGGRRRRRWGRVRACGGLVGGWGGWV